ncbi:hypothetical protein [Ciceribacter sichuanensis]|uniref:hypothetical protein n=1 Tax=Ciceribacter sichuanensis TaxID=2949647 RepID=UPI002034752E|nr:hypothetical protein [Ciceribacter sp. S153]
MTTRIRPSKASAHAPVSRGMEVPRWRASTVIVLMTVGLLALVAAIRILHG